MKAFTFLLLVSAGCASPRVWYQPGRSAADTWKDYGDCETRAVGAPFAYNRDMNGLGLAMTGSIAERDFLNGCMLSKGYLYTPVKSVHNASGYPK